MKGWFPCAREQGEGAIQMLKSYLRHPTAIGDREALLFSEREGRQMRPAMTSGGLAAVESTPLPGGKTSFRLGGPGALPAPTPGAPNEGATNPLPGASPLPRSPEDYVRGQ
jgi:hypothetical protein